MSPLGYERLFSGVPSDFRCRPESRPSCPNVRFPPSCVSFRSESGPGAEGPFSSAFDPERTLSLGSLTFPHEQEAGAIIVAAIGGFIAGVALTFPLRQKDVALFGRGMTRS